MAQLRHLLPLRSPLRRVTTACALLVAILAVLMPPVPRAEAADDIDLLRVDAADPFVLILLDTSASMGLQPPGSGDQNQYLGDLAPADGDDPGSKLFLAKKALYEVFSQVGNLSFGFATYNKDHLSVVRKHWLYEPVSTVTFTDGLSYPTTATRKARSGGTNLAPELPPREALEHFWVFGDSGLGSVAGTCNTPIVYSTQDQNNTDIRLNRFPKAFGPSDVTRLWIEYSGVTYALDISRDTATTYTTTDGSGNTVTTNVGGLGSNDILVDLSLRKVTDCGSPDAGTPETAQVLFHKYTDFLMMESNKAYDNAGNNNKDPGVQSMEVLTPLDASTNNNCGKDETGAGFWNVQDIEGSGTCGAGSDRPFTGLGWEGNWDSGPAFTGLPSRGNQTYDSLDPFCGNPNPAAADANAPDDNQGCYDLRWMTHFDPKDHPELDTGDFIPLDWQVSHRDEFLKRLNPLHPNYPEESKWDGDLNNGEDLPEDFLPYFGVARFFNDTTNPGDPAPNNVLRYRNPDEKPVLAYGNSPFSRALNDLRCWYLGGDVNKCKNDLFPDGWEKLFRNNDLTFNCRLPYLIVITDAEENVTSENSSADINTLDNDAGVRTWIFTFTDKATSLQNIISNTGAKVVPVSNGSDLKTKLKEVAGTIATSTRTFATAAVPSVQAAVESRIYLTKFQPLNDTSIWEGHVHAFSLPLPPNQTDPPNKAYDDWLWDSALSMLDQSPAPPAGGDLSTVTDLKLGGSNTQRRVLWALDKVPNATGLPGSPTTTEMFDVTTAPSSGYSTEEESFWNALQIPFDPTDSASIAATRDEANTVVKATLVQKNSTVTSTTDNLDTYILGEVFHSNPLVLGGPVNTKYFVDDAEETYDTNGLPQGTGYRDFFNRYENRRKLVITGANDGMLHAFEAGIPGILTRKNSDGTTVSKEVQFTKGTGKEVFAFIPREVMPTVKLNAENATAHRWSVDGSPAAGDVFIDPEHTGTPNPAEREWRTVVITGLREGGSGYFALDVTDPDQLVEKEVGPPGSDATRKVQVIDGGPDVTILTSATDQSPIAKLPTDLSLVVPGCYTDPANTSTPCGTLKYPAALWEFTDRVWDKVNSKWVRLDEDGNGLADLGETWSTPNIGRIKVVENGSVVNKYVAIFGGGLDPAKVDSRGNWLYMVDIETGQAIYKRQLDGSAPSDPAAVDTDQNGFLDRVYMGTTAGYMYRLDLTAQDSSGNVVYPKLAATCSADVAACVRGLDGLSYSMPRIEKGTDLTDPLWAPKKIFDTVTTVTTSSGSVDVRRPIYYPPAVLFVGDLGEYALAFGVGDRDDLKAKVGASGRFYVFVDETDQIADANLPMTEATLEQIDRNEGSNPDLLTDPSIPVGEKGWFLVLYEDERLIGDPFGFSGITFFATFEPQPEISCAVIGDGTVPQCSDTETPKCQLTGTSRVYIVNTTNADAFIQDKTTGVLSRSVDLEGFVTNPFREQAPGSKVDANNQDQNGGNDLTDAEKDLMEKLKQLFPKECKFGNHRINIKLIKSTSEVERIAVVPICIIEKNWKEVDQ